MLKVQKPLRNDLTGKGDLLMEIVAMLIFMLPIIALYKIHAIDGRVEELEKRVKELESLNQD